MDCQTLLAFCSNDASYVNGCVMTVDGGVMAGL